MKRLWIVVVAALLTLSAFVRGEGPDDKYIEIYKIIQEGDQLTAASRPDAAKQSYLAAQAELKRLQSSYPNWNTALIEFRLRMLEAKLAPPAAPAQPSKAPSGPGKQPTQPTQPSQEKPALPQPTEPQAQAPDTGVPTPQRTQAEVDDRDSQIRNLQEQLGRLQSDRSVLESKLREALSAQPAAVDPQELARAEERIRALEKDKEILNVSVRVAEANSSQHKETEATDLRRALAEAKQRLGEQNDAIMALRQEKDVLQQRVQAAKRSDDDVVNTLRAENERLRTELAASAKIAPAQPAPPGEPLEKELASSKAALQSSRETMASLQVRVRTLQDERDQLDKTRKELETKLASSASASPSSESTQLRRLQKENADLQKRLTDATRQVADNKKKGKLPPSHVLSSSDDVSGLRARLEAFEARKIPYTSEELALFKKPDEPVVFTAMTVESPPAKPAPENLSPLMAEAQRAFAARRFDEAEKKYLEVLRLDDKNVSTLQRLAATQLEQNRPTDAEESLKRALEQNPRDPRTLLLMGISKFDQNKFDEAFDSLSRSAQADPQNAETQNYLGITFSQKGQRAAAETALRKAIQLSPNYASAHYNLAVVYATQQPPFTELARWHYQKALAFGHPQNAELEKMMERKQAAEK